MSTSPSSSPPPHRAHGRASAMLGGTSRWPNPTTCVNGGFNRRRYSAPACRAAFERARVRVGASEHGWVRMVLWACRGVGGDVRGSWPCHWHARITQRPRVGELKPKTVFLGVGGQFHELVKRRKNRLRASRARSGGAPGRAHLVGNAQRARRRLAGLVRRVGNGHPNADVRTSGEEGEGRRQGFGDALFAEILVLTPLSSSSCVFKNNNQPTSPPHPAQWCHFHP
jgi:hypothetical protein